MQRGGREGEEARVTPRFPAWQLRDVGPLLPLLAWKTSPGWNCLTPRPGQRPGWPCLSVGSRGGSEGSSVWNTDDSPQPASPAVIPGGWWHLRTRLCRSGAQARATGAGSSCPPSGYWRQATSPTSKPLWASNLCSSDHGRAVVSEQRDRMWGSQGPAQEEGKG